MSEFHRKDPKVQQLGINPTLFRSKMFSQNYPEKITRAKNYLLQCSMMQHSRIAKLSTNFFGNTRERS